MPKDIKIVVRQKNEQDQQWVEEILKTEWVSTRVVTRRRIHDAAQEPALLAMYKGKRRGLLTYTIAQDQCEIVTLNSLVENAGIGSALLAAVERQAAAEKCTRLWLTTTNDNTNALHFYQRRGFRIAAIHLGAIKESRRLKPEIPLVGSGGIPILDEIELEKTLKV
jgi:GNAT superfamily N-acetyltransferase